MARACVLEFRDGFGQQRAGEFARAVTATDPLFDGNLADVATEGGQSTAQLGQGAAGALVVELEGEWITRREEFLSAHGLFSERDKGCGACARGKYR